MDINSAYGHDLLPVPRAQFSQQHADQQVELRNLKKKGYHVTEPAVIGHNIVWCRSLTQTLQNSLFRKHKHVNHVDD